MSSRASPSSLSLLNVIIRSDTFLRCFCFDLHVSVVSFSQFPYFLFISMLACNLYTSTPVHLTTVKAQWAHRSFNDPIGINEPEAAKQACEHIKSSCKFCAPHSLNFPLWGTSDNARWTCPCNSQMDASDPISLFCARIFFN